VPPFAVKNAELYVAAKVRSKDMSYVPLVAAGAAGRGMGLVLLVVFLVGLLTSNTLIALTSTFGYLKASRRFALYAAVAILTAVFSLTIGTIFLFGRSTLLPAIFGG